MPATSTRVTLSPSNTTSHKRAHLLAILPRGEAIRNYVYTGLLDHVAKEADVSLLSIVPNEEIWSDLTQRFPASHKLIERKDKWILRLLREELDLAHGRWLWSQAAQARWEWREQEAETLLQRAKRFGKKLLCYPFVSQRGVEKLTKLESAASQAWGNYEDYKQLLRRLQPTLVFNSSHVHSTVAFPPVHAAQSLGIPTATFIFSWDNLTSQGRIYPNYDYYLVWNKNLRDGLLEIYPSLRAEQVFVTGTPQFDFHFRQDFYWTREEFCARIGADPQRPLVVYTTGMANHIGGEPWIVERIADQLKEMHEFGPPQLLVRVLPKGPQGHFDELKERRKDILIPTMAWERKWMTPTLEDAFILTNTLRHADVGINVASTISLELCMFDRPVINVSYLAPHLDITKQFDYRRYYEFEHYRPVVESGALRLAHNEAEMRELIVAALREPAREKIQRANLIKQMFGDDLDGRVSERFAQTLIELSRGKP